MTFLCQSLNSSVANFNSFHFIFLRTFVHSPELLKTLTSFMATIIPDHGQDLRTVTCQYAITPDRQFIIGPLAKHPDIIIALGNGHAFKFAPAIGRVVAELAIDGERGMISPNFPCRARPALASCSRMVVDDAVPCF